MGGSGWSEYTTLAEKNGVNGATLKKFAEVVVAAKQDAKTFALGDDKSPLYKFVNDEHWGDVYFPAIVKKGGMPSADEVKEKLDKHPDNEDLKKAHEYVKAIPDDVRKEFNTKLKAVITAADKWAMAPVNQRGVILKVHKAVATMNKLNEKVA